MMEGGQLLEYSAQTGEGKAFLWKVIKQALFQDDDEADYDDDDEE
jgi:hypothetical protein